MPGTTILAVESALLGPDYASSGPVELVLEGGLIAAIRPVTGQVPRVLAMPAVTDAHNHARPLSSTSFGAALKPLELWLPQLATMPAVDPYTAAAASFARSLRGGATAVMVHLTRAMGGRPLPEEAREIARAARDVGLSIGFAVAMKDRNPLVYWDHATVLDGLGPEAAEIAKKTWGAPPMAVADQIALVEEVAASVADMDVHIDVQYGPTGVQWCSEELLTATAVASAQTGRRVHMHMLETRPQRDWADRTYSGGIVTMLDRIGLLSPRLTLAHCVWGRDAEYALIAAAGARIAVNASSNLHLSSGIASVAAMQAAGVAVAMGLDGCALDEDDDALRELRLFHFLNRAAGFDAGGLTPEGALTAACATGRAALGLPPGGVLAEGLPADILLLDLDLLDPDALMPVDARDFVMTRATRQMIRRIYAGGRLVLSDGQPTGVDIDELHRDLRAQMRAGLPRTAALAAVWPEIEAAVAAEYRGCC